jgi:hypothetical protein
MKAIESGFVFINLNKFSLGYATGASVVTAPVSPAEAA